MSPTLLLQENMHDIPQSVHVKYMGILADSARQHVC